MYEHALAERLGMTVADLEERMTIEEFHRWRVYDRLSAPSSPK
jgi:hypothetical protein